ncbi:ExeM/NucH family extracellular endonuclease [Microbacterium sp. P5_E9]
MRTATAGITAFALVWAGVAVSAGGAQAAVDTTPRVLINEVYGGGGNSGGAYNRDFIELVNTQSTAVDVTGWAVQYGAAGNTTFGAKTVLTGIIPAGGSLLVGEAPGTATTQPAITPDIDGTIAISGTAGKVALTSTSDTLVCANAAACAGDPAVVDLVGWGASVVFAGANAAPGTANSTSTSRDAVHTNTANNAADFTTGTPTPQGAGGGGTDPGTPTVRTIAEIQGTGSASPLAGQTVITQGVVTAAYPSGGLSGYVIQTAGTGGTIDAAHTASDAVFVFSSATVGAVAVGDHVRVTGVVSEFNGLTELTVSTGGLAVLTTSASVTPATVPWPTTDGGREALESMLVAPSGSFTVTNLFSTNQYGEVGLAAGATPLIQPTEVGTPGSADAAAAASDNAARAVVLDDGASTNFLSAANQSLTPPYISLTSPVRVGAAVTFTQSVIVDYRNRVWKFNPTTPYLAGGTPPATFENDRAAAPAEIGGDLRVASFNVLNYFTTLGAATTTCVPFTDRTGDGVTVEKGCDQRGAWDPADLQRQQDKIVAAINALDADVVGLLEIENSARVDGTPDEALGALVDALNAAAGAGTWAFVPSSAELPAVALQDTITNALIYRTATVERTGDARALGTASAAGQAFENAREPIGQVFTPAGGREPILVVVNHFKSKGSAGPWPGDVDAGDGQGASNESRVRQATALRDWVPTIQGDVESVALVGDFNSYTQEDPLRLLYAAGYTDAASHLAPGQYSYSFSGLSGSLDHVLLNGPALERTTGADIWEINAEESLALEYSRYNYHGTLFYAADAYRSSDHDPVVVGLEAGLATSTTTLTASPSSQLFGSASRVTLTATVAAGLAASGSVEFVAGDTVLGTATLQDGTATLLLPSTTPAGEYAIVARYAGDGAVSSSLSSPVNVTVKKVTTTTSLTVTRNARGPLSLATIAVTTDNGGLPSGKIEIREGATVVQTLDVVTGVEFATLPRGKHTYTATFIPNDPANVSPSTSAPVSTR